VTDRIGHPAWQDLPPALSPAEERQQRLARYRQLPLAELERIHAGQALRLRTGRGELSAVIARWLEVQDITDRLELSTQLIEQVLIERRKEEP
jgi:hypothetical protein